MIHWSIRVSCHLLLLGFYACPEPRVVYHGGVPVNNNNNILWVEESHQGSLSNPLYIKGISLRMFSISNS